MRVRALDRRAPRARLSRGHHLHCGHLVLGAIGRPVGEVRGDDVGLRVGMMECRVNDARRHLVGDLGAQRGFARTARKLDPIAITHATLLGRYIAGDNPYFYDHLPFLAAGVPSVDIIDLDYGYNNVYHHTVEDTTDKLSPKSLAIAGDVVLETIRLLDAK